MSNSSNSGKSTGKRPVMQTLLFGSMSISAYVFLFWNEAWVTDNFTRGGWYAAYPIATAFFFSLVHGGFTSHLITTLGLEEKK